jgi:hypothetical protein
MYMIKELYNRRLDAFIGKKCIVVLNEMESGECNPCLDVARSPSNGSLVQHTHLFSNALNEDYPQSNLKN